MDSYARIQLRAAGLIAVFYSVFLIWMMNGLTLGSRSPEELGLFTAGTFVVGAVLFGTLWIAHMVGDGDRRLADEREEVIEALAGRAAARVTEGALFVLLILALSDAKWGWMGSFALTRTEGLVFALFTISALAGIVRFAAAFRSAGRL